MAVNQATPVTGTVYTYLLLLPLILCLFKAKAHVCTPKMGADGLSASSAFSLLSTQVVNKPLFSAFTMSLYLVFGA
jgi:hypothetical protein